MNKNALLELLHQARFSLEQIRAVDPRMAERIGRTVGAVDVAEPLGSQPKLAPQLAMARVYEVTGIAGLSEAADSVVVGAASSVGEIDDALLGKLVADRKLTEAQAQALGLAVVLYELLGGAAALATVARTATFAQLGGRAPASIDDLARVGAAGWTTLFGAHADLLPAGTTAAALGETFSRRAAALHPEAALGAGLPAVEAGTVARYLLILAPLYLHNDQVVGARFDDLDTTGLTADQVAELRSEHEALATMARAYPGLGLAAVMDDKSQAEKARAATAAKRAGFVQQVVAKVGAGQLFGLDLSAGSADLAKLGLGGAGATADEQAMVLAALRSYQRLWVVTGTIDEMVAVVSAGFASAHAIARLPRAGFAVASGLAPERAGTVWDAARTSMADTALTASAVLDAVHGLFDKLGVGNQPNAVADYLRKLPGYEDMFGSLAFCDCEECQSILGPAAYFVDLMKLIDENLRPVFVAHPGHPLDLKVRRPDLWTVELTCDATTRRVPTLDIVDEVLENYVAQRLGYTGPLTDRGAVATLVYEQTLTAAVDSFAQPFDLARARSGTYLAAAGRTRAEIAAALGATADVQARAELDLSPAELGIVTTAVADLAHLAHVYGVAFGGTAGAVADVDAAVLAPAMGTGRAELGAVVATVFVAAGGARVTIRAARRTADSVQADVEWVSGLTADALDRMHRLTRLVRKTGWAIADVDLALATLGVTAIGAADVEALAGLHAIRTRLDVTVAEACALVGPMPAVPAGTSLLDRVFNPPSLVAADGTWPDPARRFIHPAFRATSAAPIDPALARLTTGLGVSLGDLAAVARHLAPHLAQESSPGFDPDAADDADRYFVLSAANLGLLYRHARLARLLGVAIDDLFQLLGFVGLERVGGLPDLRALLDVHGWWQGSGYRLDDVAMATGQAPRDATPYVDPLAAAARVVAAGAAGLTFGDTLFAVALGTTEQASRDLLAANPAIVESPSEGSWRLIAGVDLDAAAITVPASATVPTPPSGTRPVTADEVRAALAPHRAVEVLVRALGGVFAVTPDKVTALAAIAGPSLTGDAVARAVRGDGPVAPLVALIAAVRPLAVAFAGAAWDATAIDFAHTHAAVLGAGPLPVTTPDAQHPDAPRLTLEQVRSLSTYARLVGRATQPATPADLQAVLEAFDPGGPTFAPASDAAMARALAVPVGLVVGLRGRVTVPAVAATALDQLDRAARLATALAVDGETLGALVSDDDPTLAQAADALLASLGAATTDETVRATTLDAAEQPVREARRDALVDYLLHSISPNVWATPDALYEYFLLDVEAGGCSTTSRVVSATTSAQLYVHRALMKLERDDLLPTDPGHVAVTVPVEAAKEWPWRKSYRVWQANRQVFLWPENYLDPDLRDDKTPLFEDLEQELLQTDVSDQNVLDAYTKYLAGLEEVASLRLAGAYSESGASADVLHLFGATAADPPVYYYRTCTTPHPSGPRDHRIPVPVWSAWQKVAVQITGRKVSPIVHDGRLHVFWADVTSRPTNKVEQGASKMTGYLHTMSLRFTTLRPDATWTAPQSVQLSTEGEFEPGPGQVEDPVPDGGDVARLDPLQRHLTRSSGEIEPIDGYTLTGPTWDCAWAMSGPSGVRIQMRDFLERGDVDLFTRSTTAGHWPYPPAPWPELLCAKNGTPSRPLTVGSPPWMFWPQTSYANALIEQQRLDVIGLESAVEALFFLDQYSETIATVPPRADLLAVPGKETDVIVQVGNDPVILQAHDGHHVARRLGTTLVETIARGLFEDGLDQTLSTNAQYRLAEAVLPIARVGDHLVDASGALTLDFAGPFGLYFRELFFQIPYLIANALNSRGRFAAAQRWYQYIFDPTASERIDVTGVPPDEVAHRLLDRVWRYRELRGLDVARLRDILSDTVTIKRYEEDPFNPWAIARRRITALQKAVVMHYVDNLLDWADSLFTQFTMESVNEAMMLYVMASDILGARPTEIGDCGAGVTPMTYETIGPLVDASGDFLIELETWSVGAQAVRAPLVPVSADVRYVPEHGTLAQVAQRYALTTTTGAAAQFGGLGWSALRTASWGPALGNATVKPKDALGGRSFDHAGKADFPEWAGSFGWSVVRQLTPVFCVPVNADLLAYWDRVADRLYKVRHCLDIDGRRRDLALFAPPLSPADLAALEAAGLSLEDLVGATSGNLPPYRFLYLIDRAKGFAASLGGFGASLLSALERKDAEHINRVRLTQQMNMARLTTQVRQLEIQSASEALDSANVQLEAAQYRRDYFQSLLDVGLNAWEEGEEVARGTVAVGLGLSAALHGVEAVKKLLPQIGSLFAMKWGGAEIGAMLRGLASAAESNAYRLDAIASLMAIEGSFARRDDSWKHQRQLADYDAQMLARQVTAAQIRLDIASRALAMHQKSIDQLQEIIDLTDGRFTNLGLYTWLSTQLQRTYRGAYQNALALARLAEQAFRFERGDDTGPGLAPSYWDPSHAGLLAGEQLLVDLQTLERRFLETNYRTLEIDQPFALSQVDPQALVALRETGECRFTVNEVFFDLFYPGDYKRRIKAVRLTIPCITGPYVNVSARLELDKSWVRPTAAPGAPLVEVPPSRSVAIATSTAQNDAGVFELSFRDERYMPFEGLGAVSRWHLTLPKAFRQFDYETINDVVLSIGYQASTDGALRQRVEAQNAALEGSILTYFSQHAARQIVSLRQHFSTAFTRLLRSAAGTPVTIDLTDRNFPLFVGSRTIQVTHGVVLLRTASRAAPAGFELSIDGAAVTTFAADPTLGNLPAATLPAATTSSLRGQHTLVVTSAGDLAPATPPPGDASAIDAARLRDVLLYVEYKLTP
jgi:Tc toxin complex TcA C-terminal TcB-binding domain/ABC toxin N-terminal region/Neuraminidase-like domain